jgi:hypothetical protein
LNDTDFAGAILSEPSASLADGFVEAAPTPEQGQHYEGVDWSRARNLSPEQLSFICTQGGIHPNCDRPIQE